MDAYGQLVGMIERRELTDQELLSHRHLADRLGMSTQPVRMALSHLEHEGVVETVARVGTRLRRINADDFWGHLQWRLGLETQVARLASTWVTPDLRPQMIELAQATDAACQEDRSNASKIDMQFHLQLASLSGATRLRIELERLSIYHMKLAICEAVDATTGTAASPSPPPSHQAVIEAIFDSDPITASDTMRYHIEHSTAIFGFIQWYEQKHKPQPSA